MAKSDTENSLTEYNEAHKEDEISLADLLSVMWKRKLMIILIPLMCIASVVCFILLKQTKQYVTEVKVSLSFPGIEKHVYPDQVTFQATDLIAPKIIKNAGIDMNNCYFRVEEIIPEAIQATINKNPEFSYFTNVFSIRMVKTELSEHDSMEKRSAEISRVIDSFKNNFTIKYIEEPLAIISFPDLVHTMEYNDIITIYTNTLTTFIEFIKQKTEEAGFFRSKENDANFNEILKEAKMLNDVGLKNVTAVIDEFGLSKDRELLIAKINNRIRLMEINVVQYEAESKAGFKLLQSSETYIKTNVENTGGDKANLVLDSSIIEKLNLRNVKMFLTKSILETEQKAIAIKSNIAKLKYSIEKINQARPFNDGKKSELHQKVNDNFKYIEKRVGELSTKANDLNEEYLTNLYADSIKKLSIPSFKVEKNINAIKILLLTLAASFFASIFIAFFVEYINNMRNAKKQTT